MQKSSFAFIATLGLGITFLLYSVSLQANPLSVCSAYAQDSVLAQIKNTKSECGLTGELWSPSFRQHKTWCLSQSNRKSVVRQRSLQKTQQLERCGRTMQRQLPWAQLTFRVQNKLFGELISTIPMDDLETLVLFEKEGVNLNFEWRLIDGGLLYWAISNQAYRVSNYLIENWAANPNLTANGGPNPLVKLLNNAPDVNYFFLEYLLKNGARPNHGGEDYSDESFPLLAAVANNDLKSAQILLKYNANPNLYESVPPLMIAVYRNNSQMVDLLLNSGANPNVGLEGLNCQDIQKRQAQGELLALDSALTAKNSFVINALISRGAKTTQQCLSRS